VRKVARLGEQSEVVTKALAKRAPSWARRSRFGLLKKGWPAAARASPRWSSVRMKIRLGRSSAARAGWRPEKEASRPAVARPRPLSASRRLW